MGDLVFQARKIDETSFAQRFKIRDLKGGKHLTLVVDADRRLVLAHVYYWLPTEHFLWVDHIVVRQRFRKMGLGRLLMNHIKDRAQNLGRSAIRLAALVKSVGFYRRLGFANFRSAATEDVDWTRGLPMELR